MFLGQILSRQWRFANVVYLLVSKFSGVPFAGLMGRVLVNINHKSQVIFVSHPLEIICSVIKLVAIHVGHLMSFGFWTEEGYSNKNTDKSRNRTRSVPAQPNAQVSARFRRLLKKSRKLAGLSTSYFPASNFSDVANLVSGEPIYRPPFDLHYHILPQ